VCFQYAWVRLNSPYKQIWFRRLENLVNIVFLVEVNNRYGTNLNELCIKNTTPHVGTLGQNFHSEILFTI
jgi:hypothetical protein